MSAGTPTREKSGMRRALGHPVGAAAGVVAKPGSAERFLTNSLASESWPRFPGVSAQVSCRAEAQQDLRGWRSNRGTRPV